MRLWRFGAWLDSVLSPDASPEAAATRRPDPNATAAGMGSPRPAAQFAVDIPPEMLEAITAGGAIEPRMRRAEALQVPAVMRARNLIVGPLSTAPIKVIDKQRREANPTGLYEQIDPDVPNVVTLANTYEDLFFEGVAWWQVLEFGWHNYPTKARQIPSYCVHVAPSNGLPPSLQQVNPDLLYPLDGKIYVDGREVPEDQIIRFDSPNPPFLVHAARAIRTALQLDRTARLYADEPSGLGYLHPAEDAEALEDENEIQRELDKWAAARARRAWGYLDKLTPETIGLSPKDLQLADARQHAVLEIARAAGVDPEDLGVSTTSRTYANQEQRWQALINLTLAAYQAAVEQRLSMRDLLPRGYTAKIKFDHFLKADLPTRMQAYVTGKQSGAFTTAEIREAEDKPALTPEQAAALPSSPPPAPATVDQEVEA